MALLLWKISVGRLLEILGRISDNLPLRTNYYTRPLQAAGPCLPQLPP